MGLVHPSGSVRLNRATPARMHITRALLASAVLAAALTLGGCFGEDGYDIPGQGDEGTVAADAGDAPAKEHAEGLAAPHPHLQGGIGARSLEAGYQRTLRAAQGLSDLPLVGRPRTEGQGRRSPGARGLLSDHARADESQFQLLSRHQYRLPQRLRPGQQSPRRVSDDPRRLLLARLLRHDRRGDRRNLFAGARVVSRRPEGSPAPGLSVSHDAGKLGPPPQQSESGLLADDQGRQRPFPGVASRA